MVSSLVLEKDTSRRFQSSELSTGGRNFVVGLAFFFNTDEFRRFGLEVRHESLMTLGQVGIAPLGEEALVRKLNSYHMATNVCA
ncbi:hypothetical protein Bca4012_101182 [Brassica carinata]